MNKLLVSSLVALVAFGANIASAQTYYYSAQTYGVPSAYTQYTGSCTQIVSDLSYGSRGEQVTQLQRFLVSQNFPGSGAWMITGNFRSATLAAVRNFQQQQGISVTGVVDAATRAAMYRVSCGGNAYGYGSAYPYNSYVSYPSNNTNCYYTYPYTCNNYNGYGYNSYNGYNTISLTSLSATAGLPGTSLTINGYGFDPSSNTVYVGGTPISSVSSYNGTALTFTLPTYISSGSVTLYVVNTRGTSNTLSFNVLPSYGCSNYYNSYSYGYGSSAYGYCPPVSSNPTVSSLSPNSGAVGTSVTVYGSGFSSTGNTVRFGGATISNVSSYNGTTITFVVPSYLTGVYGSPTVTPGVYSVSVSNSTGYTSNAVTFTVTTGAYGAPTISGLNGPTSIAVGTQGLWTIRAQNPSRTYMSTSVNWGDSNQGYASVASPQTSYQEGENTLSFTHTYQSAGTYSVVFTASKIPKDRPHLIMRHVCTVSGDQYLVDLFILIQPYCHVRPLGEYGRWDSAFDGGTEYERKVSMRRESNIMIHVPVDHETHSDRHHERNNSKTEYAQNNLLKN